MKEQTAVEFLKEKFEYWYWMVKRDEISGEVANQWFEHFVKQAKAKEREQIEQAYDIGFIEGYRLGYNDTKPEFISSEDYYNQKYGSDEK